MAIDVEQIQQKPRKIKKVTTDPAVGSDEAIIYPKEINGVVELFSRDSAGNITQITQQGSLSLPQIPSLVPAGGTKETILAKVSDTDYSTSWFKLFTLMKEFYFKLPSAPTLADRISALGSVTGLTLNTAENDPNGDDELGSSPNTLVLTPVGLSGVVMQEVSIMELTTTGAIEEQGWKPLTSVLNYKSNTALTKGAIVDLGSALDTSKDILVRVRFIPTTMNVTNP